MTDSKKIQEGLELIRSAEKSLKTTFLKWRPDYEVAADEYSKAATCFKIGKSFEQCKDCYMKASECHKQNRSLFHAAKNLEQAILVCKDLGDLRDIPDLAHKACTYYQQQGSPDAAASALDKAAKILEPTQPDQALQLYKRAAEVVTIEDSPRQAAEYVSKIARILVKLRMYDEAADAIRREIGLHQQSESIAAMGRLTVALVLVQLARGDTVAAEKAFKEWGNCCDAPEVQTLESLLQAFDEEDPDDARQALNSSFIKHMDIEYARLARDLPLPQPTIPRAPAKDTAVRPNAAPSYVSPNQSKTQDGKGGGEEGARKKEEDDEEREMKPGREMSSDGDDDNGEVVGGVEEMSATTSKEGDDKQESDNVCSEPQGEQMTVVLDDRIVQEESEPSGKQLGVGDEGTETLLQLALPCLPTQTVSVAPNLSHPSAPPPTDFQSPPAVLTVETSSSCQCKTPYRKRRSDAMIDLKNQLPCKKLFPEDSPSSGNLKKKNVEHLCDKQRGTPRPVIPTKDNPPPEITDWLQQFQRWTNAERILAIDRLIVTCEPTQVRHMMQLIEPQFQRDFISLLPKELALLVLSFLEPKDLLRAAQTCRSWRFLAEDNLLWREKCRAAGITRESPSYSSKRARHRSPTSVASPWKAAFMRQHRIEMNWRIRPMRSPKVLKGHDDHVITCLQFSGSRIVSGSDDNTLKVWSATTGKCLRTLVGHTGGVWSSQMSGSTIISGSTDRTLKVWNAESGQCLHTLYGHTSTVRCMHLHGKKVVSGSRDATLRVWDIDNGECLHVLVGHLAAVRCVQYDGRLVVSGAYDYMVKVWNPDREECLHTLQGHTNRVYSLQFDGVHVVSGSLDTSIRVWEVETGQCRHTLMGHQSLTSGMELTNNILVSGNADSTVKVWDILTGQCLQTLSGVNKHQSAVTCLQFNNRFVITSSDDGTVKLWDVKTGEFIRNLVSLDSGGSGGVVWRIRANETKLVCAVGSRNGTEETKLLVLDFDVEVK